jgi:hypothetical protein
MSTPSKELLLLAFLQPARAAATCEHMTPQSSITDLYKKKRFNPIDWFLRGEEKELQKKYAGRDNHLPRY